MTRRLKLAGAAMLATLALSPAAMAHYHGHAGSFGGNTGHISSGPVGIAPHYTGGGSPIGLKQNYGTSHNIGNFQNQKIYSGPKIVHPHPGGSVITKHIDHDGDHDGRHHHHHHGGAFFYTSPYYYYDNYYDYGYYNDDSCSYYWRRYLRTGNPKWKYRYYDCVG
jgi:hypothetical protein